MPENKSKHQESQEIPLFVEKYDLKSGVTVDSNDPKLETGKKKTYELGDGDE